MKPEQALQIIEKVRLSASMSGQDHDIAKQAVGVLSEMVNRNGREKEDSEKQD